MSQLQNKKKALSAFSADRILIADALMKELAEGMNTIHGTTFSYRFWKIVLQHYVNVIITKKSLLENKVVMIKPDVEAINGFNFPTSKERLRARTIYNLKALQSIGVYSRLETILSKENNVTYGFQDIPVTKKELGQPLPSNYPFFLKKSALRERDKANKYAETYDNVFYKNAVLGLPKVYIEYFKSVYDSIKLFNPEAKVFHVSNLYSTFDAILVGKYIENGAKLFYYQHGGYYGELIGHNAHYHESSIADQFRTWGWKLTEKDVPWKAYRLEKFKDQYRLQSDKIRYDCLLCYPVIAKHSRLRFESDTKYFLEHINIEKFRNILARPRPVSKFSSMKKELNFIKDGRVTLDSARASMSNVISKSRIVIQFTYPSTNFMECLYVDHPTIAILKNEQPTSIIKPYYDFFIKEGVFHSNFESMVNHLNQVDIDEWWRDLILHPTYKAFKNEFLRKV